MEIYLDQQRANIPHARQQLPTHIKDLSTYNFPKTLKEYLLAEQLTH